MANCSACKKKFGFFERQYEDDDGKLYCGKCAGKKEKLKKEKEEKIIKEGYDPKKHVKEIKCKCNQCGKVWHYLESEMKSIKSQQTSNACIGCGSCGSPTGAYFSNKAADLDRKAKELQKCPNCGSSDVTKTEVFYEKK
jgi:DNA-directed RNA polymerase subunit M/transcription elongation factor TFIIS